MWAWASENLMSAFPKAPALRKSPLKIPSLKDKGSRINGMGDIGGKTKGGNDCKRERWYYCEYQERGQMIATLYASLLDKFLEKT